MGNIDLNKKGYEKIASDIIQNFKKRQIEGFIVQRKKKL